MRGPVSVEPTAGTEPFRVSALGLDSSKPSVRVVYVLGTGRCGSTILDLTLGSAGGVVSVGELWYLPTLLQVSKGKLNHFPTLLGSEDVPASSLKLVCSCGQTLSGCSFWTEVVRSALPQRELAEMDRANRYYEGIFSFPIALCAYLLGSKRFLHHLDMMALLSHSIAAYGHATTVIDSSKYPWRGWLYLLLRRRGVEVLYVHIIRDGATFLQSVRDHYDPIDPVSLPPPWPAWAVSLYYGVQWVYINLLSSLVGFLVPQRYIRVRYEDLVSNPMGVLHSLSSFLNIDVAEVVARVSAGSPLSRGHVVLGNRTKLNPILRVKKRPAARVAISKSPPLVFRIIAGWLQRLYGYG